MAIENKEVTYRVTISEEKWNQFKSVVPKTLTMNEAIHILIEQAIENQSVYRS